MTAQQIENSYRRFLEDELHEPRPSQVEYIGINFHEQTGETPVFKCYYSTTESLRDGDEILRPFLERDMIHALNWIQDTRYVGKLRYEIGLGNRTNENMLWLYRWIEHSFALSQRQRVELDQMKQLTCCSLNTHRYAALYYLGFITSAQTRFPLEAVKPHYILRTCENPEKIGKQFSVDTEKVLRFLKAVDIPALADLAELLNPIAGDENELWMVAMDFFSSPGMATKYKIYLKDKGGVLLQALEGAALSHGLHAVAQQLAAFDAWLGGHPQLGLYGVAVCLTGDGEWSVNCYM